MFDICLSAQREPDESRQAGMQMHGAGRLVCPLFDPKPCAWFSSSQDDFEKAAAEAKDLPDATSNDDQLILYGLFKQANIGDCNTSEYDSCG